MAATATSVTTTPSTNRRRAGVSASGGDRDGEHDVEGQRHDEPDRGQVGLVAEPLEVVDGRGHGHDHEEPDEQRRATGGERPAAVERAEQARSRGRRSTAGRAAGRARRRAGRCSDRGSAPARRSPPRGGASSPRSLGRGVGRLRRRTGGDWCHGHRTGRRRLAPMAVARRRRRHRGARGAARWRLEVGGAGAAVRDRRRACARSSTARMRNHHSTSTTASDDDERQRLLDRRRRRAAPTGR